MISMIENSVTRGVVLLPTPAPFGGVATTSVRSSLAAAYVSPAVRDAQAFGDPSVSAGEEPL